MTVNVKKLRDNAVIPTRGSAQAAGFDLYAAFGKERKLIRNGETEKIGTGIAVEIPEGYFGAIFARSGLATKEGLRPATCVSVIDSDYRGEIFVPIYNDSIVYKWINSGDRIAQLVLIPYLIAELTETDELGITSRGEGGFGSTGSR